MALDTCLLYATFFSKLLASHIGDWDILMKLELLKKIYYISGMFGLHASIVLIRCVTHFHSALAPGDGWSLIINRLENAHVPYSK